MFRTEESGCSFEEYRDFVAILMLFRLFFVVNLQTYKGEKDFLNECRNIYSKIKYSPKSQ